MYTPGGGQKGGTLFKFTSLSSPSPFLGTWEQIQRQRGGGLLGNTSAFVRGVSREKKGGVKRAASDVIRNEIKRSNRRRQDIFGV